MKKMGKKKKVIVVVAIVLVLVAVVAMKMKGSGEAVAFSVTTEKIATMDLEELIAVKGTIQGSEMAEIASAENREIVSIFVKEGDKVSKGQTMARLKPSDTQKDNESEKIQAKREVETAKFDYEAKQTLFQEGAISKQDLLQSKTTYDNSMTKYNALLNAVTNKEKNEIVSPISGTVTRVNANVGLMANQTQNNQPLFVVEDLNQLEMQVKISEYDIGKIKVGQTVKITGEVLGEDSVSGVVNRIAPTGELKEQGSKEMVVPVTISITTKSDHLIAGVSAKAEILIGKVEQVTSIPLDAVLTEVATEKEYAYLLKKGVLSKVDVELGLQSDFYGELRSDTIKKGDKVVLNPTSELSDGMAVTDLSAEVPNEGNN